MVGLPTRLGCRWQAMPAKICDFPKAVVYWNSGLRLLCEHSEALRMGGQ
jgi:hypothetical protein